MPHFFGPKVIRMKGGKLRIMPQRKENIHQATIKIGGGRKDNQLPGGGIGSANEDWQFKIQSTT